MAICILPVPFGVVLPSVTDEYSSEEISCDVVEDRVVDE